MSWALNEPASNARARSIRASDRRYRRPMIEEPSRYEHRGDPLAEHVLTRADHRRQEDAERMAEHVRKIVDNAPPLSAEQATKIRSLLFGTPTPRRDLMRWRVRLYCGHVVEWTAHRTHMTISSALSVGRACPTCGLDPATIVAAVPLGLMSDPADPRPDPARLEAELASVSRRAAAAEREHRELSARATRLRHQLEATYAGSDTEARRFVARAAGKVIHRRDCRTIRATGDPSAAPPPPHLLELTTRQATEWLRESTPRRRCKTCRPDIEVAPPAR